MRREPTQEEIQAAIAKLQGYTFHESCPNCQGIRLMPAAKDTGAAK